MAMTERRLALSNLASRQTEPLNSGQSCWAGWAFSHSLGAVHFWLTDWRRPLQVGFGISDPFIVRARIKAKFKREIADKDPTVRAVAAEGLGVYRRSRCCPSTGGMSGQLCRRSSNTSTPNLRHLWGEADDRRRTRSNGRWYGRIS